MDVLSSVAAGVRIAWVGVEGEFRRDHDPVAQPSFVDKFPQHLLAPALSVAVGGIEEIAAKLDVTVEDCAGGVLLGAPAPLGSECHCPEAKRAHPESRATQRYIILQSHMLPPMLLLRA